MDDKTKAALSEALLTRAENSITDLKQENAELRKDAERYRWLRDNKHLDIWWSVDGDKDRCKNIDDDIDAAMKGE